MGSLRHSFAERSKERLLFKKGYSELGLNSFLNESDNGGDNETTESSIELEDDQSMQEWRILLVGTRTYACKE